MGTEKIQYEPLTAEDVAALACDQGFLPAVLEQHYPQETLTGTEADLDLIQKVADGGPYSDEAAAELIALGTALGDIIAASTGMQWIRYSDDEGIELALRYRDTSIVSFPRSMLIKRFERDEEPQVRYLWERVCATVREMVARGEYDG
jgi:hypothetical protein